MINYLPKYIKLLQKYYLHHGEHEDHEEVFKFSASTEKLKNLFQ
jgi:hypothetical protein